MSKFGTDPSRQNKKNAAVDPTLEMPAVPDNDNPEQGFELTAAAVEQVNAQLAEQEQSKPAESDPAMISAMAAGSAQAVQEQQQKRAQQAQRKQQPAAASQPSTQPTGPIRTPGRLTGFDEALQQVADEKCREEITAATYGAVQAILERHEAEVAKSRWTVSIQVMSPDGKLSWSDFEKKFIKDSDTAEKKNGETYVFDADTDSFLPLNQVLAKFAAQAKLAYTKVYEVGGKSVRDDSLGDDPRVRAAGQRKKEEFFASKGITI